MSETPNDDPPGPNFITFYGHTLQKFVLSQSVCPFPTKSNVCEYGQEPTVQWST